MVNENPNYFEVDEFDLGYEIDEAREESGGGGFVTLPEGTYLAEIVKMQGWKSQNSQHKAAAVTLKIIDSTVADPEARKTLIGALVSDKIFLHVKFRVAQFNDSALGMSHGGTKLVVKELLNKKVTIRTENEPYDYVNAAGQQKSGVSTKVSRYESPAVFGAMSGEIGGDVSIDTSGDV